MPLDGQNTGDHVREWSVLVKLLRCDRYMQNVETARPLHINILLVEAVKDTFGRFFRTLFSGFGGSVQPEQTAQNIRCARLFAGCDLLYMRTSSSTSLFHEWYYLMLRF